MAIIADNFQIMELWRQLICMTVIVCKHRIYPQPCFRHSRFLQGVHNSWMTHLLMTIDSGLMSIELQPSRGSSQNSPRPSGCSSLSVFYGAFLEIYKQHRLQIIFLQFKNNTSLCFSVWKGYASIISARLRRKKVVKTNQLLNFIHKLLVTTFSTYYFPPASNY